MSASTETSVASGALAHLGQPPIADLATGTDKASRVCRQHFGKARDAVLRLEWWNFATAWVTPAADATAALGPLAIRYPLPADCIDVRFVDGLDEDEWAVEAATVTVGGAAVEARVLVTNADAPLVCYTRRIESPALWDALFVPTMEFYLAGFAGPQLGRDPSIGAELFAAGAEWLAAAKKKDAREKARSQVSRETSWVTARYCR